MLRASPISQVAKTRILWLMGLEQCIAGHMVAGLRPAWTGRSPVPTRTFTVRVFPAVELPMLPVHDGGRRLPEPRKSRPRKCWWRGPRHVQGCVPPKAHLALVESLAA